MEMEKGRAEVKAAVRRWFYNMGQAVIGGVAAAGSAWLGTAAAHAVSSTIAVMDWNSFGAVLLTSSVTNLFFFLKQSPLPPMEDTTFTTKPTDTTNQ
jgi:hypothetical protein